MVSVTGDCSRIKETFISCRDVVELYHLGQYCGKAPEVLTNLLEIRELVLIDVSKMFGISSIR